MTTLARRSPHRALRHLLIAALLLTLLLAAWPTAPAYAQGGSRTHVVQAGENLFRIALNYGLSVDYLAAANGIANPRQIYVGQVLIIPDGTTPPEPAVPPAEEPAPQPAPAASTMHTVQAGETLASIGRRYGVSWTTIASANGLTDPNHIYAGQQLVIPSADAAPAPAPEAQPAPPTDPNPNPNPAPAIERVHVVQRGEHLAAIARSYGLNWRTLALANNLSDPNHIYAGQRLLIPDHDFDPNTYTAPAPAPPPPTITEGKQIVVDLSDQRVYAYENGQLVRNVLVSTGVAAYPTVQGDYEVYLKYVSQTMSGPGYYLPGVPYILYFYQGYSLHGTYWHNNFGTPMSHGCVNMPTPEAEWLFNWAPLGTPVHVQW